MGLQDAEINTPEADTQAVVETTDARFGADVLDASQETPVIVDFWAPSHARSQQIGAVLEAAVRAASGAVRLVKLNIEEHPAVAGELQIKSIPAVMAFDKARPVDGFVGLVPEARIRQFVARLAGAGDGAPAQTLIEAGQAALNAGDLASAAQAFGEAVRLEPGNPAAIAGLAKCYIKNGDTARAEQTLGLAPEQYKDHADIASARAALALAGKAEQAGDAGALETKLAKNPDDHQARFDLALALNAKNRRADAIAALLEIIRRERSWNEGAAKKQILELFDAYGAEDESVIAGRRKLSALLFN